MASKPQKTKNGWYYIVWTDRHKSPRQVKEALKTQKLNEARAKKSQLESDYYNDKHDPWRSKWYERQPATLSPTLKAAVEEYVRYKANLKGKAGWGEYTAHNYSKTLRHFAGSSDKLVSDLGPEDLHGYYYRDVSDHTRKSDRTRIKTFINWCVEREYLKESIDSPVDEPQEEIPEYLTTMQLLRICAVKKRTQINDIYGNDQCWMLDAFVLAARTGLRLTEMVNIQVADCRDGFILVGATKKTKSNKQRKVPIMNMAHIIISRWTDRGFRKDHGFDNDYLFGRVPTPKLGANLSRVFTLCREKVLPGQSQYTFHSLRHTFAVWYLVQPGDNFDFRLYKLQRILGHASMETTMKYLKAIPYDLHL